MQRVLPVVVVLGSVVGCGNDPCDPQNEVCTYAADVSTLTVAAGAEDEDTCQSWTLNNPTELWVNAIQQSNDGGYHHANWFFVPDDQFDLPDGTWSCNQNNFGELVAALEGGYLFALSTQSHSETQTLPAGSAIRIPPYSRIIGSSHLLNTSDEPVTTTMHLAITTMPPSQVAAKLAPARISYHDLKIAPIAKSSFTTECDLGTAYDGVWHRPLAYKLYYTLVHYHQLGIYQQLEILGGPRDGEVIMRHDGYGDNAGHAIEPPLDLAAAGARGLRLTCGFDNPRAASVGWGIGDQEMCVMALQAVTDIGYDADVVSGSGTQTGTTATGEIQHMGPCSITAFPWDFDKPGGQGH
ncbi:MAG TPA: hypothetical protein VLB44_09370 [Kofleriaceae bacterium]|nr:hypothetical protein [Kofleriaceae bacterium]